MGKAFRVIGTILFIVLVCGGALAKVYQRFGPLAVVLCILAVLAFLGFVMWLGFRVMKREKAGKPNPPA